MDDNPTPAEKSVATWRPRQAYILAAVCLLVGLPIGYLIRGSAQAAPASAQTQAPAVGMGAAASSAPGGPATERKMPTLDDMKRMADKQAEPLLEELKSKPNDAALLNKVALVYKAAHQFERAAEFFQKSLESDPKNIAVRDDYASCLYYIGHIDEALAQLQKSLTYDPKHAGTLFNIGMIKWKGKGDVDGAVASWKRLLQVNPNFERRKAVEQLIQQAKATQLEARKG
jgi:tetratricopeptide (TPR) repeat protein